MDLKLKKLLVKVEAGAGLIAVGLSLVARYYLSIPTYVCAITYLAGLFLAAHSYKKELDVFEEELMD